MIFIQIASYRDPELLPTIVDCIAKARYKNDLRFGICWQKTAADRCLDPLKGDKRFRIEEVPWQNSRGLGWARAKIQQLYADEDYTLQLDSHHRFAQDWDAQLIEACALTGSPKPIISSYAGMYDPVTNRKMGDEPYKMVADRFTDCGTILFRPQVIAGWQELMKPVRARFVSGHFFFTLGRHCRDYSYDPALYFAGDEISLSIRSFTLGYDLFHPHRTIIWHEYTRQGRVKHWDDHTAANGSETNTVWHEQDAVSKRRLRKLLREEANDEDISAHELGGVRSHRDYERYAGIDFARRRLHPETLLGLNPPCAYLDVEQWQASFASECALTLKWNIADLEKPEDLQFIYFGVEDDSGNVVYRYDAPPESTEAQGLTAERTIHLTVASIPTKLVVWPVSRSRGWLKQVAYRI